MARCTAPVRGHRSAAACPACSSNNKWGRSTIVSNIREYYALTPITHLLIIILFFPTIVHSEQWFTNGDLDNTKSYQGGIKDFGAMILMTTNSKKALENWSKPTKGVSIPSAEIVSKGKPIEALVFFSGCTENKFGNCISEVDYIIHKPDGTVYAEYKKTELWRNKPAFPKGKIGLAVDRVGLIADPEDPIGIYKVTCTVRDLVANYEFKIFTSFKVIEANK